MIKPNNGQTEPRPLLVWDSPPPCPLLHSDEVHVWFVSLSISKERVQEFSKTLSAEEMQRVARLRFDRDQQRFIAARGMLKRILGAYLARAPEEIRLIYGARGKPAIDDALLDGSLRFNLSHTHQSALVAVASGREVGVDLEDISRRVEAEQIVDQLLTVREQAVYRAVPQAARQELFLRYWTCKEAFAKATGEGLTMPLEQIEIVLTPNSHAQIATTNSLTTTAQSWTLHEFRPSDEEVGALVTEGSDDFCIRFWRAA